MMTRRRTAMAAGGLSGSGGNGYAKLRIEAP